MGEVASGSVHYHVLFGIALILFVLVFVITLASSSVMFRRRERGGLR
jgi:ABC-type phosphate transport system permease subunit